MQEKQKQSLGYNPNLHTFTLLALSKYEHDITQAIDQSMIILEYFGFMSKSFFKRPALLELFLNHVHWSSGEEGIFHFEFMNHSSFWQCQFFRKFLTLHDIDIQKVFPFRITAMILQPVTLL